MAPYNKDTTNEEVVRDLAEHIKGKVVLTTGVSPSTLGATFVKAIAQAQPELLILAGRNSSKLRETAETLSTAHPGLQTRLLRLDLSSLAAVREAAAEVTGWSDVPLIDVLVNNAGIMATDFALSADGFESQFATNHLGHFLFTNLIMAKLLAASARGPPRVVAVSSDGHRLSPIRWADYNFTREGTVYNKWQAYGQSKSANMLMAVSLAEKLGPKQGLLAFSINPGTIFGTSLAAHIDWDVDIVGLRATDKFFGNEEGWQDFKVKTAQQGAATHIYAAFDPSLKDHNGAHLEDSRVADPWTATVKPWATSSSEAERLWKLSEELVGQEFKY